VEAAVRTVLWGADREELRNRSEEGAVEEEGSAG